jgi:hypothetical protein
VDEKDIEVVKNTILSGVPAGVAAELVLERIPYIFGGDWSVYRGWRKKLAEGIGVDACNICLTGSASAGVSLNPNKRLSPYGPRSDIDVAIISAHHFDIAWRVLRSLRVGDTRNVRERQALVDHQKRYIYWGTIATDKIVRFFPFAKQWTVALSDMRAEKPTDGRAIKFRIYKDYDALRSYQVKSVEAVRSALLEGT